MIRSGYEDNLFLSSALVDFYAKCFAIVDARKVFSGMKIHDQVSGTSLMTGFSINRQGRDAFLLFKEMLDKEDGLWNEVADEVRRLMQQTRIRKLNLQDGVG